MRTVNSCDVVWTEQDFIDARTDALAAAVENELRKAAYNKYRAAKEQRKENIREGLKGAFWLAVLVIGICAYNGIWWPFWYAVAPIYLPLLLLYAGFASMPAIPPIAVVIFLLFMIWIKLDTRK
jgi:hypothetical protein